MSTRQGCAARPTRAARGPAADHRAACAGRASAADPRDEIDTARRPVATPPRSPNSRSSPVDQVNAGDALASASQLAAARPVARLEVLATCHHRDDRPPDREFDVLAMNRQFVRRPGWPTAELGHRPRGPARQLVRLYHVRLCPDQPWSLRSLLPKRTHGQRRARASYSLIWCSSQADGG